MVSRPSRAVVAAESAGKEGEDSGGWCTETFYVTGYSFRWVSGGTVALGEEMHHNKSKSH